MGLSGSHDTFLVILSLLIAVAASFTALDVASRIRSSRPWSRRVWLSAAAIALGGGIWSMHFVAMLAFSMPGMRIGYDLGLTLFSLAIAVGFTGAGFALIGQRTAFGWRTVVAGVLMGLGVVAMHYVGMAAMRMPAALSYQRTWVAVSVLIAIGAAIAALWLGRREQRVGQRLVAALVMGAAIAGMHYAGMRAATFTANHAASMGGLATLGQTYLAVAITGVTLLILLFALGAARLERLFEAISRREARNGIRLKLADILRGGDSQAALQEVAALMGEHFQAARTGYGELDANEDIFQYDVCWTDGSVPPLLGRFPASAFGVKIVAELTAGRTVVVEDLLEAELSDEARTRVTAREVDTRSILVVPFVREGRLRTIVYLNDRRPRRWLDEDVAFMEELAERTRLVIEREAAEARLKELNATLEARVEERTAELRQAQEALLQSQKMEAVGQLVSGLAHDFNNVLGAVVGALDLISRRSGDPERVRQFAEAGLEAARRGSRLTSQLLTFSRSRNIELQPLLVCDVIERISDMISRTLGPTIHLELDLNPSPVPVMADPTQVEMTILNLAINARDAMPDGGRLTIGTAVQRIENDHELADGDYVEISVRDTGSGMEDAVLRRAMEPFFTTKPVGKGTGLGLAQIYGSARQAGGTVRIESAVGVGTTVRVMLPCTTKAPVRAQSPEAKPTKPVEPMDVLIVDDDHHHRRILASALETLGHRTAVAIDGPSALSVLETNSPDAAVLDFAMPGMNGAQLARAIKDRWPDLPIIFASGFPDIDAIQEIAGADAKVLRKPFQIEDLLAALAEVAPAKSRRAAS